MKSRLFAQEKHMKGKYFLSFPSKCKIDDCLSKQTKKKKLLAHKVEMSDGHAKKIRGSCIL